MKPPPITSIEPLRVYTFSEAADLAGMDTNSLWDAQRSGELHIITDLPPHYVMGTATPYVVGADLIRYRQVKQGPVQHGGTAPYPYYE
jgi:hypothetical protein